MATSSSIIESHAPSPWAIRQVARAALAATLPRKLFMVRGPRKSNRICLTFDDGPYPEQTPRLLDVLKQHRVPATFFVVGRQAERHPDIIRRIADEGHELGHHTFDHRKPETVSAAQLMREIERTTELLERLTGNRSRLFRPPWGKLSLAKLLHLWRAGQSVVLWNVDPKDCSGASTAEILSWFQAHRIRRGDIVLMHDDMPHGAAIVPQLVQANPNLEFATVSDLLADRQTVTEPVARVALAAK